MCSSQRTPRQHQILSDQLSAREAQAYCTYAASKRQKVEAYWGATWSEPVRIHVDRNYRISRALVPGHFGKRGFMEMPLRVVRNADSALLHEIVHIYAPNANRFLAEGLAVYLHQKLASNPAFPNYGRPLRTVLSEESAYQLAGSFVGFLIEKYGLPEFRKLYDAGAYESVYGKGLAALEAEWRAALEQ